MEPSRILVVDDEAGLCWVLERFLRREGFSVTTALKGAEALDMLDQQSFAIVFVDAKLPDVDGLELTTLIRQRYPHTYIIMVSGYLDREDALVMNGLHAHLFDSFLVKPFDLREARRIVHRAQQTIS